MKWNKEKAKVATLHAEKTAHFGRACATEQDLVQHSSNIECPEESFSIVDGFKIIEVSANTENNVPDGIRKHALFRPGNQRGEGKSGENCQRPRKRSRTVQEAWILRKKKYRKRIARSKTDEP